MTLGLGGTFGATGRGSCPSAAPTPTPSPPSRCRHSHGAGPVPAMWPRANRPETRQCSSLQAPCAEPGPARGGVGGTTPVPSRLGCGLVRAAKCELSQVAWVLACRREGGGRRGRDRSPHHLAVGPGHGAHHSPHLCSCCPTPPGSIPSHHSQRPQRGHSVRPGGLRDCGGPDTWGSFGPLNPFHKPHHVPQ